MLLDLINVWLCDLVALCTVKYIFRNPMCRLPTVTSWVRLPDQTINELGSSQRLSIQINLVQAPLAQAHDTR